MLEPILAALPDEQRRLWPALADVPDGDAPLPGTARRNLGQNGEHDRQSRRVPLRDISWLNRSPARLTR